MRNAVSLDSWREHVVVGGGGEVGDDHAVLDALLEVDVLVQGDVGPEVHELDLRVGRADAVDAAEPLDDPHRVPVDVVVDDVVAVLEVLALADAVGADQHVDLAGARSAWTSGAAFDRGEKSVSTCWKSIALAQRRLAACPPPGDQRRSAVLPRLSRGARSR